MESDRQACLAAGMVDHVSKPIDVERLIASLLRHTRSEHPPMPTTSPVLLDSELALRRLGGDHALYAQIVQSYQAEAQAQMAGLQQGVAAQQWQDASRYAHTLKGLSGTVGALAMAAAAAQAELALKLGAAGEGALQAEIAPMQAVLVQTVAAIDTYLAARVLTAPHPKEGAGEASDAKAATQALLRLMDLLKESNMRSTTEATLLRQQFAAILGPTVVELDEAAQQLLFTKALEHAQDLLDRLS